MIKPRASVFGLLLATIFLFSTPDAKAQDAADLYIFGAVKDYDSRKKMEGCVVNVYKGSSKIESYTTNKNGKFEFFLPLDAVYKIDFTSNGYVTKFLEVSVENIPDEDRRAGFSMGPMDVSLFKEVEGLDFSLLEDPIGKARYYGDRGAVEWDNAYTSSMLNAINKMMSDYEKQKKDELKEVDKEAKELAKKQEEFDKLVAEGNDGMSAKDYKKAVEKYTGALAIFDDKPDVKAKRDEAQEKWDKEKADREANEKFEQLVDAGDTNFEAKNYEEAISKYEEALTVKPNETYPADQISKANTQLEKIRELKAQEEAIANLMDEGTSALSSEKFDEAIGKFEEVLKLDPTHKEAEGKLAEANSAKRAFEDQEKLRADYDAAIANADQLFNSEDYEGAKSAYSEAASLMPNETYPNEKIQVCDEKITEIAENARKAEEEAALKEQFDGLVAEADELMSSKSFDEAIDKYDEALNLVADKDQSVLDKKQAAMEARDQFLAEARAGEEYDAAIAQADGFFNKENYEEAIGVYQEALKIKENDPYPQEQIAKAEAFLEEIRQNEEADKLAEEKRKEEEAAAAEKQKLFNDYMSAGNEASDGQDYEKAMEHFNNALEVIPDEKSAQSALEKAQQDFEDYKAQMAENERNRLEEEERLAAENAEREKEANFNNLVADGDANMESKSYQEAIADYEAALEIQSDKKVSKKIKEAQRLFELDEETRLEAERLAEEERLRKEAQDAEAARLEEEARLEAERLAEEARKRREAQEAEQALKDAEKAELERYQEFVSVADKAFAEEEYEKAIRNFENALEVKPEEAYPSSRIEKIRALIDQKAEEDRLAMERAAERKKRNAELESKASDLNSDEESQIDAMIAEQRKQRERDRWSKMKEYKDGVQREKDRYQNQDNEQLTVNMENIEAIKEKERETVEAANERHARRSENMAGYKEGLQASKERMIEKQNDRVKQNQEELASVKRYTKDYSESEEYKEMIEANAARVKAAQDFKKKLAEEGKAKSETTHKEMKEWKKDISYQKQELMKRESSNLQEAKKDAEDLKKKMSDMKDRGTTVQIENGEAIAQQTENFRNQEIARQNAAKKRREESAKEMDAKRNFQQQKSAEDHGESNLAAQYPEGVTEERTEEGRNIVLRRIVVHGNVADEYKKVVSISGTYYFKNGASTSKYVWDVESKKAK